MATIQHGLEHIFKLKNDGNLGMVYFVKSLNNSLFCKRKVGIYILDRICKLPTYIRKVNMLSNVVNLLLPREETHVD